MSGRTIEQVFYDGIKNGDWEDIRMVYRAIIGREAPEVKLVPKPMDISDILQQIIDDGIDEQKNYAGTEIPKYFLKDGTEVEDEVEDEVEIQDEEEEQEEQEEHDDTVEEEEEPVVIENPSAPRYATAEEFHIEHGEAASEKGSGQRCKRKPIKIPKNRQNMFVDDGKEFADESVKDKPHLGVQKIRDRSGDRDPMIGVDTSRKFDVECSLCSKKEQVSAALAMGYNKDPEHNTYRCNDCSTPNGRARAIRNQNGG